jgi:hypothetical protein
VGKFPAQTESEYLFAALDWFDPIKLQSLDALFVIVHFKCIVTIFMSLLLRFRAGVKSLNGLGLRMTTPRLTGLHEMPQQQT